MEFVKVEGLGNDFLVFDGPFEPDPADVVAWCDRRRGVGGDGVLVIESLDEGTVKMRYWNADGGEAEMCGNGLRCVARLAYERGWVSRGDFIVRTAVGDHPVVVYDDVVHAFVGTPSRYRTETLEIDGVFVHPLSIGNPHAVIFVDTVADVEIERIGPLVETDPLFPDRTNVEFVEIVENGIRARIWERGVGETPASGTGATAAAYMAHAVHGVNAPVRVELAGGFLTVSFDDAGAWMDGPAEIVFRGSIESVS
ncbi:MAG: diaminopimelate epimerase [Acidimicrobiia bacterium]